MNVIMINESSQSSISVKPHVTDCAESSTPTTVWDLVASGKLDTRNVSTDVQTADIFTKPLPIARFQLLASKIITDRDRFRLRGSDVVESTDQFFGTKFKLTDLPNLSLRRSVKKRM
ncbi:hypothetical protein LWI28_001750 [Acer negundo]|uniref:Uncharacterized protein n=1 Tax=Acer negundo TaxID=4023 RepID=A0AAD5IX80_ACENE|nr:hypothetical protein LWI28_001750 [Acer negundo]